MHEIDEEVKAVGTRCKWCTTAVPHNQEWCVWCMALRTAARYCTTQCLELALADKKAGLL